MIEVPGLISFGHEPHGHWICCWALATRPLHDDKEREETMRRDGFDPSAWALDRNHVVHKDADGNFTSSWYITPYERKDSHGDQSH